MIIIACNSPLLAIRQGFTSSGAVKYIPLGRYAPEMLQKYPDAVKIPCGKCRGCRAQRARSWADRMILELDHSQKAVFLTLTYDNDHVPCRLDQTTGQAVLTLNKRDLQLFFKRLRKHFSDPKYPDNNKEIRYYACGEYGSHTHRPHYHVILFGLSLEDFVDDFEYTKEVVEDGKVKRIKDIYHATLEDRGCNGLGDKYYSSNLLEELIWKNGFCLLGNVTWKSCAYVARYVKKKDMGFQSDEYVRRVIEPEFSVSSRNPGIGLYYTKEHPDCFEYSVFHFADNGGSVEVFLPPAFLRGLKESKLPSKNRLYEELMTSRRKAMNDNDFNKMMQSDLDFMDLGDMAEEKLNKTADVIDYYRGL